jgi:LuxR family maltose regulon positive regulatory protein
MNTTLIAQLIATKLYPPALPIGAVARPRLFDGVGLIPHRPLTSVEAPAGFGKSTLLAQWREALAQDGTPAGWLSLDADDNPLPAFLPYLIAALQQVRPGLGGALFAQLMSAPEAAIGRLALASLINELAALRRPFVLFLDDFHLITNPEVHDFLGALVLRGPAALRLVVASRSTPPLPMARLRVSDAVWELTAADLRFTAGEAARFLRAIPSLTLAEGEADRLQSQTEGWVAGLRLASLSRRRREGATPAGDISGTDPTVTAFFMDDVLKGLPDEVQDFLVRTSMLDRLGAGVCDAVTGRADGGVILERLVRDNIFTLPADPERRWFRYHHLFAAFLRERARAALGPGVADLHRAAAAWFEAHGLAREAVQHTLAAGDMERAAEIIEARCLFEYLSFGLFKTYHGWMALLPDAVRRKRPLLALLHVWRDINDRNYRGASATLRTVEAELAARPELAAGPLALAGRVRLFDCLIAAYSGDMARFHAMAAALRDTMLDDGPFGQVDLDSILGYGQYNFGALDEAQRLSWIAHRRYDAIDCWWGLMHSKTTAGMSAAAAGRLEEATELFEAALALGRAHFDGSSYMVGLPSVLLGSMRYEREMLDLAEPLLRAGIMHDPEIDRVGLDERHVVGYGTLARLLAARGRGGDAFAVLDHGERFAFQTDNRRLILAVRTERARLFLNSGRVGEAQSESDRVMAQLAEESGRLPPLAWQVWEPAQILRAQINVARHRAAAALETLDRLAETAARQGRLRSLATIQAVQAMAQEALGARDEATRLLAASVATAATHGMVRCLADLGPDLAQLLGALAEPLALRAAAGGWSEHLRRIEAATGGEGRRFEGAAETPTDLLSDRERQVVRLVARGLSNRDIGTTLGIREQTVKTHLKNVFGKLAVSNRTQAAAAVRRLGLG